MSRFRFASLFCLAGALACDAPGHKPPPIIKESTVTRAAFDTAPGGTPLEQFTLTNSLGMEVRAISLGATIRSISVPDAKGALDNIADCGAVMGRYAGPIAYEHFTLDGKTFTRAAKAHGFDQTVWTPEPVQNDSIVGVAFNLVSPDGDQGFPGTLTARVTYTLFKLRNELRIDYEGATDKPTPVDLTNHTCFNLAGFGKGAVSGALLTLEADSMVRLDVASTGKLTPVNGTRFDFRTPKALGTPGEIFFVINRKGAGLVHAARVVDPTTGRTLDLSTTEPGVQFVLRESVFTLAPQHFPDSPNQPNFPNTILRPGAVYRSQTLFSFGVVK